MVADYLELDIDTELDPDLVKRTIQRAEKDVENLRNKRNEEKTLDSVS